MSRIGNKPVPISDGAKVSLSGRTIEIEGPKGKLSYEHRPEVTVVIDDDAKEVRSPATMTSDRHASSMG